MRLWSIHPRYLDPAGLTDCWREGLPAREVLCGRTSGYRNHPQLARFKEAENPVRAIDRYLETVWEESVRSGYRFDATKVVPDAGSVRLTVSCGQPDYEFERLKRKSGLRSPKNYMRLAAVDRIEPHPCRGSFRPRELKQTGHPFLRTPRLSNLLSKTIFLLLQQILYENLSTVWTVPALLCAHGFRLLCCFFQLADLHWP